MSTYTDANLSTLDDVMAMHDVTNVTVVAACLECHSIVVVDDVEDAQRYAREYDMTCCTVTGTVVLPYL